MPKRVIDDGSDEFAGGSDDDFAAGVPKKQKAAPSKKPAAEKKAAAAAGGSSGEVVASAGAKKPTAAAEKRAATTGADAVLDYVRQLNAPLNAQMVADHFRQAGVSKAAAEKHLLSLAENGHIEYKLNGKAKVFYASQEGLAALAAEEMRALDVSIAQERAEKAGKAQQLHALKAEAAASRKPKKTLHEWQAEEAAVRGELASLESELAAARRDGGDSEPLDEATSKRIAEEYSAARKVYMGRRRMCLEILDNLGENMQKSRKQMIEAWELEGDDAIGVKPDQFPLLPQPRSFGMPLKR